MSPADHRLSGGLIAGGFIILAQSWPVLYEAQQRHGLATRGPYAYVRHPQYAAFIVIMLGFLLQWPTLLTLVMFPILTWAYVRLARREEQEVRATFGESYARYGSGLFSPPRPAGHPRRLTPTCLPSTREFSRGLPAPWRITMKERVRCWR